MTTRRNMLIALSAGLAAAPLAALAQRQPGKIPRVTYLTGRSAPPDPSAEAVQQGLRELGYVEGRNIQFEAHYFGNRMDRMPSVVTALVQKADLVISPTAPVIGAAKQATRTVPIVVLVHEDPVASGLVATLARPGANITGISTLIQELAGKRLELLKEAVPKLIRVAVLWNSDPDQTASAQGFKQYGAAARALKLELVSLEIRRPNPDLEGAFQAAVKERAVALVAVRNTLTLGNARRISELAVKHRLPYLSEGTEFIEAGALMSYSANVTESFKRLAVFVDKILKGAKPSELPIEQASEFELVINMKTAKAIGLAISKDFLLRADRVIE